MQIIPLAFKPDVPVGKLGLGIVVGSNDLFVCRDGQPIFSLGTIDLQWTGGQDVKKEYADESFPRSKMWTESLKLTLTAVETDGTKLVFESERHFERPADLWTEKPVTP